MKYKWVITLCRTYLDSEGVYQNEVEGFKEVFCTEEEIKAKCKDLHNKYDYITYRRKYGDY